jgi:photosystem II stability/assembly factor-like uncharacterized protein
MMPQFPFSFALAANEKGHDPLTSWQYRYLPFRAAVQLLLRTTGAAGNVTASVSSGSETIQQRAPVQVGGTAGVTPSVLNTQPIEWVAGAGDVLMVSVDENAGATPTVDGLIIVNPV